MGSDRGKSRKRDTGRDAGGFVALPWSVLDNQAYLQLSHPARTLLLEIARQFVRDNNGRLLASRAYLAKRGWNSASLIDRTKQELLRAGLIFETLKGHRPNKASWYAVTWRTLDRHPDHDPGVAAAFERGAYRLTNLPAQQPSRQVRSAELLAATPKNAALNPSGGTERSGIGPAGGTAEQPPVPSGGSTEPASAGVPVPSQGHHLEKPSARAGRKVKSMQVHLTINALELRT